MSVEPVSEHTDVGCGPVSCEAVGGRCPHILLDRLLSTECRASDG